MRPLLQPPSPRAWLLWCGTRSLRLPRGPSSNLLEVITVNSSPTVPLRRASSSAAFRLSPYRVTAVPTHPNGEPDVMALALGLSPEERIVSVYPVVSGQLEGGLRGLQSHSLEALIERREPAR